MSNPFKPSTEDRKKYVLSEERDFEILALCKELERHVHSKSELELVKLIKSQLEKNWRLPLIKALKKLLEKYS